MDAAHGEIVVGSSILFSKIEDAAGRFPDFVAEIQAILRQGKLPVGTVEAVPALADGLAQPGHLRDDLLSMVNALCYQEPGTSTLDLVGLLLVAAAGERGAEAIAGNASLEEPVRRIFNSLVDARRSRQEEDEARLTEESAEAALVEPQDFVSDLTSDQLVSLPLGFVQPPTVPPAASRGSVLARALAISADEQEVGRERVSSDVSAAATPMVKASSVAVLGIAEPREPVHAGPTPFTTLAKASRSRRVFPGWALGLCGVLVGLLLGFFLQKRLASPAPVQVPATADVPEPHTSDSPLAKRNRSGAAERERGWEALERLPGNGELSGRAGVGTETPDRADRGLPRRAGEVSSPMASGSVSPGRQPSSGSSSPTPPVGSPPARPSLPSPVRTVDLNATAVSDSASASRSKIRLPSVVTGASGIMAANLLASPAPAYPVAASEARVQGEVVVQAVVDRDGNVTEARVVSGPLLLRDAALDAVQRWQYRPYEVDGKAAEIGTTARVEFRLNH